LAFCGLELYIGGYVTFTWDNIGLYSKRGFPLRSSVQISKNFLSSKLPPEIGSSSRKKYSHMKLELCMYLWLQDILPVMFCLFVSFLRDSVTRFLRQVFFINHASRAPSNPTEQKRKVYYTSKNLVYRFFFVPFTVKAKRCKLKGWQIEPVCRHKSDARKEMSIILKYGWIVKILSAI
jgi:hypothetical protein